MQVRKCQVRLKAEGEESGDSWWENKQSGKGLGWTPLDVCWQHSLRRCGPDMAWCGVKSRSACAQTWPGVLRNLGCDVWQAQAGGGEGLKDDLP